METQQDQKRKMLFRERSAEMKLRGVKKENASVHMVLLQWGKYKERSGFPTLQLGKVL